MLIRGIQAHGLTKLIARRFILSNFEQRVGEILMDGRAVRRQRDGLLEACDGLIVVLFAQAPDRRVPEAYTLDRAFAPAPIEGAGKRRSTRARA